MDGVEMEIIAHRGDMQHAPENTMAVFRSAYNYKVDGIELDVQFTKDGVPVVIHDDKIDRTTNGRGYVRLFTYEELQQFDAGSWFHKRFCGERIPSLFDVLIWAKEFNMTVLIELKKQKTSCKTFVDACYSIINDLKL